MDHARNNSEVGGAWDREIRVLLDERSGHHSPVERRRYGGNYYLSPKLSSLDHAELKGGKEKKEKKSNQPTPPRTKRRLPRYNIIYFIILSFHYMIQ